LNRVYDPRLGILVRAARGGSVRGPGDGKSDSIPAMLSDGEHVIDAATVNLLGSGSTEAGHRALERIKREVRKQAGVKKPEKPPRAVRAVHRMVARAKKAK